MALNQIKTVASAIIELHWAVFCQRGGCFVPHLCSRNIEDLVSKFSCSVTKIRVLPTEDEIRVEGPKLFDHIRFQQISAAGNVVALAHFIILWSILTVPTVMDGMSVNSMKAPTRTPK